MTHHRAGLARILKAEEPASAEAPAAPAPLDDATIVALNDNLEAIARRGEQPHPQLTPRERAMLVYAIKLTATPAAMVREDVSALRDAGLDDGEILDLNQVTAYFAYANRVVDGLGVDLEFFHSPAKDGDGKT